MNNKAKNVLTAIIGVMALGASCLQSRGAVTVLQNLGTAWTNNPPYAVVTYDPPATSAENNYGGTSGPFGTGQISLGQSFSLPGTNLYVLTNIQISVTGGASTNAIFLYDLGTNNNGAPTNPQWYTNVTQIYTTTASNLFSSGLTITNSGIASQSVMELIFSGVDAVTLVGGHKYVFEIDPLSATQLIWYRGGASPPYPSGAAYRSQGNLNGGGNWREFSMAVGFVGVTNLVQTNSMIKVVNPVYASYGPPTKFPYSAGIAISTYSDNVNTDESFAGSSVTVMGETFKPTRDCLMRDFFIACRGTTNSGNYILLFLNLGSGTPPTSFNPASYVNLAANSVAYNSFSPNGMTNSGIVKLQIPSAFWQTLSPANTYFIGLSYAGGGSNDMVWERTTGGASYASGTGYKGTASSIANTGFPGGVRNLLTAIDVQNPNLAVSVTNATLTTSWPTIAGQAYGGHPVIQIPTDPFSDSGLGLNDDPLNDNAMGTHNTAVLEGVANGLALSMSFIATNDFNLGAIAFRQRGIGSSNCLFTIGVYDVTNNFFSQGTNGTNNKWPFNFQPNIDTSPKGVPVFGTNVNFYYPTNVTGLGTNDQVMILTLNQPANQVLLYSNHVYLVEVTAETIGQNANVGGLFQWVRDVGQIQAQIELFPDVGDGNQFDGFRTNAATANTAYFIIPRALSRTFTDPETFAGVVAGNPRDFVMAVYAAPPTITIASVSRSGSSVTLNWNSNGPTTTGATYSVLRKVDLNDISWTPVATGLTSPTYTDNTASATTGLYKISSP